MPVVLWVALGGAIGSAARYGVNVWSGRMFGTEFPWHTPIVNVLGCFIMGVLTELIALKLHVGHETRAFLTTGAKFRNYIFKHCYRYRMLALALAAPSPSPRRVQA